MTYFDVIFTKLCGDRTIIFRIDKVVLCWMGEDLTITTTNCILMISAQFCLGGWKQYTHSHLYYCRWIHMNDFAYHWGRILIKPVLFIHLFMGCSEILLILNMYFSSLVSELLMTDWYSINYTRCILRIILHLTI